MFWQQAPSILLPVPKTLGLTWLNEHAAIHLDPKTPGGEGGTPDLKWQRYWGFFGFEIFVSVIFFGRKIGEIFGVGFFEG